MLILWAASAWYSYYGALAAATSAYDRTLLASARTVAERLTAAEGSLRVDVPYVVLDSFERNMRDRLFIRCEASTIGSSPALTTCPPCRLARP